MSLLWLCLLEAAPVNARTLHVFIATDDTDRNIGHYVRQDGANVALEFQAGVATQDLKFHELEEGVLTGNRIRQIIRRARIAQDDAIFFYYSGHGGYRGEDKHFLSMKGGRDELTRNELISELQRHQAALTVVVTDACYNLVFRPPPPPSVGAPLAIETEPLFQRLFFQTNGFIDINACTRGQIAATCIDPLEGSVFTKMLTTSMQRHMNDEDASFGWHELFDEVSDRTAVEFAELFPGGHGVQVEGNAVQQVTQTPHAFAMNIQKFYDDGNVGGNNSVSNTRLGLDITAENSIVLVSSVKDGGPATQLNYKNDGQNWYLERGDQVVSINGSEVDCVNCFSRAVRNSNAQMQLVVKSATDGKLYPFTARLNPLGADDVDGGGQQKLRFGIWVESYNGPGARIVKVQPNSPATRVLHPNGQEWFLETGDIVTQVNGRQTNGQDAVTSAVFASPQEMTLEVIGARDKKTYRFRVQLWNVN